MSIEFSPPYISEALTCLAEGETIENIDKALVQFGFPVGPIQLLDEAGIDIGTKITPILVNEFGEAFCISSRGGCDYCG